MAAQASANVNSQVDDCIPNIVSNLKKMCIKKGESVNNRIPDRCKEKHVIEKGKQYSPRISDRIIHKNCVPQGKCIFFFNFSCKKIR